ncbi:unnamed protein product [Mucor hiemalis]
MNNGSTVSSNQPKFALEVFPHTISEANRQQGEHYLLKHVFQSSYFAPIEETLRQPGSKALDIGCGTHASWIIDVANDFPNCTFYGFDLVEPFSLDADIDLSIHIPSNCQLKKLDLLIDGFQYEDNTFDYTHQRLMHLIYHGDKIPWMFQEMLRVTKVNGWIELLEPDITPKRAGPIFGRVFAGLRAFLKDTLGRVNEGSQLFKRMEEAGIVDIKTDYGSIPVCWGGYIGKLVYEDMLTMLNHIGLSVYEYIGLEGEFNKETYDALIDSAFDECVEYQTFFNIRWVCGRKPSSINKCRYQPNVLLYVQTLAVGETNSYLGYEIF